jgi:nicotinate-nucleotide adenylyltransferase
MRQGRTAVGILGGTFDPIHLGHLAMARAVREAHGLEKVLLVPAATPPHKRGDLTPFHHRLAMVERAIRGEEGLAACDLEGRRGGISFTVDTLADLARAHPDWDLHFIIGEDSIPELPLWKDLPRILALARVVAVNRSGPRRTFDPLSFPGVDPRTLERCERDRVEMPPVDIASREVRRAAAAGQPFERWLPAGVAEYIRSHRLYGHQEG